MVPTGDRYVLITREEYAALQEIRKAGALVIAAQGRGRKEELRLLIVGLDRAERKYDELELKEG